MLNNLKALLNNLFKKERVIHNLELVQDFIVISLCIGLFSVMLLRLGDMFFSLMHLHKSQQIISDILFILIMVELFRLLVIYLREHRISLGAAVEVAIVSALREVILYGILEIQLKQIIGVCSFLIVLGVLLLIRLVISRLSKTDSSENDPKSSMEEVIL
ncbi:phosphate-starvation-inducible PsiE family protein [Mastigocoleus sp. MO_188.B34]|uniref:phosphate-starvation-inducible PsiE family protein n=1 Tax=Mastigocoleus sp. MO_188.B34 TaxID=3036635 RepID=UPI0026382282|nr:phosphate-starvation-inducible PsiE family protein [Mastigocoleus sp. MO_188.B34]MDJ0696161.1 phosphate-starvation-inducible PsiE family protein [Mastigocoleus sp. MO_188.B34]